MTPEQQRLIRNEDVQWARENAARGRRRDDKGLIELLEERLACEPGEFVARLSATLRMPDVTLEDMRRAQPAFDLMAYAECTRRLCVALRLPEGGLTIALGDPYDLETQEWIEAHVPGPFRYRVAHRLEIQTYLSQQEAGLRALDGVAAGLAAGGASRDGAQEISFESASESDSTVVRLVTSTIYDALKAGASDIHLETNGAGLAIKYRIDGVLTPARAIPGAELAEQVISRIKVVSELDIAERRVPQDGRFKARHKN
jgi:general secretion pathway protein E